LRGAICSRVDEGVEWDIGDKDKVVSGILSTNGWKKQVHESGIRTIPEDVHRLLPGAIVGVV